MQVAHDLTIGAARGHLLTNDASQVTRQIGVAILNRLVLADHAAKLATEHLAHNYHKQFGLPTVSIRPFNIYGPGQVGEGAVHAFVTRAVKNETIRIHNDGDQIRAWCYIDDIVESILLCLEKDEAIGQAFNIGNARSSVTIYQLARLVVRLAESRSPIEFVPWNFADVELRIPDTRKAQELLGFRAQTDLEDGLLRTIAWYREKLSREGT